MAQINLFTGMEEITQIMDPEPGPEINTITRKFKKRIIGDNFIVVKCLTCSQLIMVDPYITLWMRTRIRYVKPVTSNTQVNT